jgi:hypothetical protein
MGLWRIYSYLDPHGIPPLGQTLKMTITRTTPVKKERKQKKVAVGCKVTKGSVEKT